MKTLTKSKTVVFMLYSEKLMEFQTTFPGKRSCKYKQTPHKT